MVRNLARQPEEFSERNYVKDITSKIELLHKELDVNREEQNLINQRIDTVKEFILELPATDPQYGIVHAQLRMDQVELDELRFQEEVLLDQINKLQTS